MDNIRHYKPLQILRHFLNSNAAQNTIIVTNQNAS